MDFMDGSGMWVVTTAVQSPVAARFNRFLAFWNPLGRILSSALSALGGSK